MLFGFVQQSCYETDSSHSAIFFFFFSLTLVDKTALVETQSTLTSLEAIHIRTAYQHHYNNNFRNKDAAKLEFSTFTDLVTP